MRPLIALVVIASFAFMTPALAETKTPTQPTVNQSTGKTQPPPTPPVPTIKGPSVRDGHEDE